jgi:uridine phosphorylase
MFIDYYLKERNLRLEDLGVAPLVVGTWFERVTERLATEAGAERAENWPYGSRSLYSGEVGGRRVSFVTFPVGAPGTVALMEELISAGAGRFIGLGMAGSLQERAPVGSYILPGECVREEGTSSHYLPPGETVAPDPLLQAALVRFVVASELEIHQGPHWTTDAIYREFVWKIEKYRADGILGVDMETPAMYALGLFHNVPVANLLVVSDELWRQWRPAFYSEELSRAMRRVSGALLEHLPELAG